MKERENKALLTSFDKHETSLMVEDHLCYDQSCALEMVGSSNLELVLHALLESP